MRKHGEIANGQGKPEKVPETSGLASSPERPRLAVNKLKRPYRYRVSALIGNLIAATQPPLMRQESVPFERRLISRLSFKR